MSGQKGKDYAALKKKAFKMLIQTAGSMSLTDIAARLKLKPATVRGWAKRERWGDQLREKTGADMPKGGARPGSQYALGCMTSGAPKGSANHFSNALWSKRIPQELIAIMAENADYSTRDLLWNHIQILNAQIIYALRVYWIEYGEKDEKRLKKLKGIGVNIGMAGASLEEIAAKQDEYYARRHGIPTKEATEATQQATAEAFKPSDLPPALYLEELEIETITKRDKQAQAMNSITGAMAELRKMIAEYENLYLNDSRAAEFAARIKKLDAEVQRLAAPTSEEGIAAMKAIFTGLLGGEAAADGSVTTAV